jgi:hypothetical protein
LPDGRFDAQKSALIIERALTAPSTTAPEKFCRTMSSVVDKRFRHNIQCFNEITQKKQRLALLA